MSNRAERSYGAGTLPTPELNPLLNPVLGQNMGRWAEVYFSNPPEKRDQAVLELLRELEAESSALTGGANSSLPVQESAFETVMATDLLAEIPQDTARCQSCGRINPATHKFCGMCGKPVGAQDTSADLRISDLHAADLRRNDLDLENRPQNEPVHPMERDEPPFVPVEPAYEPTTGTDEFPLFQSVRGIDYSKGSARDAEIFTYPPERRAYRLYVGLALVSVLLGLAYLAWRTTQNTQSTHVEPLSPPVVATQPSEPAPAPPSPATTDVPPQTARPTQPATAPAYAETQAEANRQKRAARISARKAAREAARAKAKAPSPPASVSAKNAETAPGTPPGTSSGTAAGTKAGSGAEELAIAQSYLNGTNGQQRNRAEAAKWLWKSVSKQNAEATFALSELYLKGDGVGKNCDQARVLLDAAARKGVKEAGERLRHLPAFGCQ